MVASFLLLISAGVSALGWVVLPRDYAEAYRWAVERNQPLIVFVAQPLQLTPGAVCLRWDAMPGAQWPSVVIGNPDGAGGFYRTDLYGLLWGGPPICSGADDFPAGP